MIQNVIQCDIGSENNKQHKKIFQSIITIVNIIYHTYEKQINLNVSQVLEWDDRIPFVVSRYEVCENSTSDKKRGDVITAKQFQSK